MNVHWLYALTIVLLAPSLTMAESNPWLPRLPFEQAVITYEISGMETGQEILYIRDFGERTARHRETSATILGITQKSSSVEITTPEWIYTFDLRQGTGSMSVNPVKLMIDEYDKLTPAEQEIVTGQAAKMAGILSAGLPGSVEEHAREILGYSCDRLEALGSTIYSIHGTGITLLSETDVMGIMVKSTATAIDESGADMKYFSFPQGIEPQPSPEADQMARLVAQQTMAALKDPDRAASSAQGVMGMPPGQAPAIPAEDRMQMEEAMNTIKEILGK